MKHIKFITFIIVITLILAPSASAQETLRTMTIVPPTVEKTFDPGTRTEGTMKVINDSSEALTFRVDTRDYIVVDDSGTPNLLAPNSLAKRYSGSAWIGVYPSTFTVQPHDKQNLNYFVQVPNDATPGGHYAAVVFEPVAQGTEGTGSTVKTQVGTLFYISVNGDIKESATIKKFVAAPFSEYGPVTITTNIQNLGDLHIKPLATITVTDMLGRTVAKKTLEERNIFPGAQRTFETAVGQNLMVGPFTAKFSGVYGLKKNAALTASYTFWVFPWRVSLVVVLIIIAVILGIMYRKKNRSKSKPQEATTEINADKETPPSQPQV